LALKAKSGISSGIAKRKKPKNKNNMAEVRRRAF
jgi:hypothetical protein